MKKRLMALLMGVVLTLGFCQPVSASSSVPREKTKEYKVAFYAFDCYHMQDENGKRYGYGYDMMQDISKYLQCTFSYVGYDKSAQECVEMLRDGDVDIYTAAKKTPEREAEFAFSTHPAITATTCMNVKRGNKNVVPGDYSTYNGLRIGLLQRHTYNEKFLQFTKEKGFSCEIIYYTTPTELSNALINGEVDALVNSYIRTPEDEETVENFGETPYYFMARKEDQSLIDAIDDVIDEMNVETPNWRSELYNIYYGSQNSNTKLTREEEEFLKNLQEHHTVIRAAMKPDRKPYSWFDDGKAYGIVADIFTTTAKKLNLEYEIVPVSSKAEYETLLSEGKVDVWIDMDSYYEDEGECKYKLTEPYLTTTVSILHSRAFSGRIKKIGVVDDNKVTQEIVSSTWPGAEIILLDSEKQCVQKIVNKEIDCALMKSYEAQKVANGDIKNRLSVAIVPGAFIQLKMGVNSKDNRDFYDIWEKTLSEVSTEKGDQYVQDYLETTNNSSLVAYLFDHPFYLIVVIGVLFFALCFVVLYIQSTKSKNRQMLISKQLSEALAEARRANDAKFNFFSKMSHDIRTPLNAVLGMTQIAKQYKDNETKLDEALDSITSEGNYLLAMINSILDINQLDHGHIELLHKPFNVDECMKDCLKMLKPLADKKEQKMIVFSDCENRVVVGDPGRFNQIIVNIVSNAIKYTQNGGEISVSLESLSNNRYRFRCADNGIGMDKEFVKHICEEYMRAEDSRTSATEGTGLGMAVAKGFTDLMQGTLSIESELGQGSTFTVELPFDEATAEQRDLILHSTAGAEQGQLDLTGKKVLLVEDNTLNAEIATEILKNLGLTVDWANNGEVGVQMFEQSELHSYFAIFMDMQMPVMDGIEATRCIRSSEREDRDVLIFAMTANTLTKDQQACEEVGMNGYIPKPIKLKEIESAIREKMVVM